MTTAANGESSTGEALAWHQELKGMLDTIFRHPEAAARCRRGLGKRPMAEPLMWDFCIPVAEKAADRGQKKYWRPADAEAATHHVLTLYAVHQQSQEQRMTQPGIWDREANQYTRRSVGYAAAHLYRERENPGIRQRFLATATAGSVPELAGHLRHLIPLLREEGIPLDYLALFENIADWASPHQRHWVRRQWGLDFHSAVPRRTRNSNPGNDAKEIR